MSSIKTDDATLNKFRKDATHFSKYRDELKSELTALEKFKKDNEKARFRSGVRKEAKTEIADVLIAYAQSFVNTAQKAINDFATIDAALYKSEKTPQKNIAAPTRPSSKEATSYKRKARSLEQKELIPTTQTETEVIDVWSDWDSEND